MSCANLAQVLANSAAMGDNFFKELFKCIGDLFECIGYLFKVLFKWIGSLLGRLCTKKERTLAQMTPAERAEHSACANIWAYGITGVSGIPKIVEEMRKHPTKEAVQAK